MKCPVTGVKRTPHRSGFRRKRARRRSSRARPSWTTRERAVRTRADDRNRGRKRRKPAPGVERLLIVLRVAERTPPPPGRPSWRARPVRGRRAADAARHAIGLLNIGARRRRHGRPQPAAGAPSSPARRPESPCRLHGLLPASPRGPHEVRHARRPHTLSRRRRLDPRASSSSRAGVGGAVSRRSLLDARRRLRRSVRVRDDGSLGPSSCGGGRRSCTRPGHQPPRDR
jgi:hypothetical protein